jgi:hypothetical protein
VILISDGVVWRVISHVNATAYEDLIESWFHLYEQHYL